MLKYIAARLREPSTLAGLSALGIVFGLPPGTIEVAAQVVVAVAGVTAVMLPDPKRAEPAAAPREETAP